MGPQLRCGRVFANKVQREGDTQRMTDIQKYFQRAINPLVSLRILCDNHQQSQ